MVEEELKKISRVQILWAGEAIVGISTAIEKPKTSGELVDFLQEMISLLSDPSIEICPTFF